MLNRLSKRAKAGKSSRSTWATTRKRRVCSHCKALETATSRAKQRKLGAVTIFSDAQAASTRMTLDEPGPSQMYAIAPQHPIIRRQEPDVKVEISWCPVRKGNEIAGGWAKHAAHDRTSTAWSGLTPRTGMEDEACF